MRDEPRKTPLVFYRSGAGAEPVRAWLKALDATDRVVVGQDLMRAHGAGHELALARKRQKELKS